MLSSAAVAPVKPLLADFLGCQVRVAKTKGCILLFIPCKYANYLPHFSLALSAAQATRKVVICAFIFPSCVNSKVKVVFSHGDATVRNTADNIIFLMMYHFLKSNIYINVDVNDT